MNKMTSHTEQNTHTKEHAFCISKFKSKLTRLFQKSIPHNNSKLKPNENYKFTKQISLW